MSSPELSRARLGPALLAVAFAGLVACSDAAPSSAPADAGSEAPVPDAGAPDVDASPPAPKGVDCTSDVDLDGMKKHLSCTGLYADIAAKKVAADVQAYAPAVEFWSDGAQKSRWVRLPPGAVIDISNFDEWVYPDGIQLWKEFVVDGKRAETRLFEKRTGGAWRHTVYRWNADETEATRKDAGELLPPTGTSARKTTYEIPASASCASCHNGRLEPVLGFDALSLAMTGAAGVTLRSLDEAGRLSRKPPSVAFELPGSTGATASPSAAAQGWLHANCGACHNDNANAFAKFTTPKFLIKPSEVLGVSPSGDAGVSAPATAESLPGHRSTVCVASKRQDDAGAPILLVRGGAPDGSLVATLAAGRVAEGASPTSSVQMPPLVTRAPDPTGNAKLGAWIGALPACP